MNIAIVINSLRIGGGAERAASVIGSELQKRGHNVFFVVFKDCELKYPIEGEYQALDFKTSFGKSLGALENLILRAKKIALFCREKKIETVVSFMEEANFPAVISRIIFGNKARIILSVRANPLFKGGKSKLLMKILHGRADMVVANSKATEKILNNEFGLKKTFTVYNTVDLKKIEQEKDEPISAEEEKIFKGGNTFINISRLTRQKGQWHLIRSFFEAVKSNPEAKLAIIGDGELDDEYRKMISKLGLDERVFFLGRKQNVFPYLFRSRGFIFTSIWEGMPNVLLEAAALGLPIISTDCPTGPREIIAPELEVGEKIEYPYGNKYGILLDTFDDYPFYDSPAEKPLSSIEQSLAGAIVEILNQKQPVRKTIKDRDDFLLDNVIELWEMLIKGEL